MSNQIHSLIQKAHRYLRSAEVLRIEGDYDSAASRLYYAMFYAAEATLLSKNQTYSSHRGVIAGFGQHLVKTGELVTEMHAWLREAFDKRQQGDYSSASTLDEQDIQDLQVKATQFLQHTEDYLRNKGFL